MERDVEILPGVPFGVQTNGPFGDVTVHTWAPRAERVELVTHPRADRPDADADDVLEVLRLDRHPRGHFAGRFSLGDLGTSDPDGFRYRFRLHREDGSSIDRADPASRWQPDGVHGPSAPVPTWDVRWSRDVWRTPLRHEVVVYELHIGTFTPEGTFEAAIERLDHLADLGVTVVEVMPVAPFAGERNWGYDGVFFHAVHHAYGGPHGMRAFVDACHARGIAVWLDVVFNHVGPEGNVLDDYGPFFGRGQNTWGAGLNTDGPGSDAVRRFVVQAGRQWVRDLRVDGFRLDAVHAIEDSRPVHVLAEFTAAAREEAARQGREIMVVAESDLADASLMDPVEDGGWGVDMVWNDDFHHVWHTELTGERDGYYVDFDGISGDDHDDLERLVEDRYVYSGTWSPFRQRTVGAPAPGYDHDRFVVCLQNHDQVGNRPAGDRLVHLTDAERLRAATLFLLCGPFTPMLFQGEEWGETRPFPFFTSHTDEDLVEAVRKGRREEFKEFASWAGEVPDPQDPATFASAVLEGGPPEWSLSEGYRTVGRGERLEVERQQMGLQPDPLAMAGSAYFTNERGRATPEQEPVPPGGWLAFYRRCLVLRRKGRTVAGLDAGEPSIDITGRVVRYRREGPPGGGAVEMVINLGDEPAEHDLGAGRWGVAIDTGWSEFADAEAHGSPSRDTRLGDGPLSLTVPPRTGLLLSDDRSNADAIGPDPRRRTQPDPRPESEPSRERLDVRGLDDEATTGDGAVMTGALSRRTGPVDGGTT